MIIITQGDTANLGLTAVDGSGNPIDLTGAAFTTYIRGANGVVLTYPNGQHTANPDQTNFKGQYVLALANTDTQNIPFGNNKEIVTLIVIGATQINYRAPNILTVLSPVPRM